MVFDIGVLLAAAGAIEHAQQQDSLPLWYSPCYIGCMVIYIGVLTISFLQAERAAIQIRRDTKAE